MSSETVVPKIVELFEAACAKQFDNLGAYIKKADDNLHGFDSQETFVTTSITAQSEDLILVLYVSVSEVFLLETMPMMSFEGGDIVPYQEDWCMELANRFLGDLKNQLVSLGCEMRMGLPCLSDSKIKDIHSAEGYEIAQRVFVVDSHLLAQLHNLTTVFCLQINLLNEKLDFVEDDDVDDEDCFDIGELEHL